MLKQCKRCKEIFKHTYKGSLCYACTGELKRRDEYDSWLTRQQAYEELIQEHFTPEDPIEKRRRFNMAFVTMGVAAKVSRREINRGLSTHGTHYKALPLGAAYKTVGNEMSQAYKAAHPNNAVRHSAGGTP